MVKYGSTVVKHFLVISLCLDDRKFKIAKTNLRKQWSNTIEKSPKELLTFFFLSQHFSICHKKKIRKKQKSISKDISVQTMGKHQQQQGTTTKQKDGEKDVLRLINKS